MKKIKFFMHSCIDVITNSSTVIYTYQDSEQETKALVTEVLKLIGITDKTADDIFFYGVFCEEDRYLESDCLPDDSPKVTGDWGSDEYKESSEKQVKWLDELQLNIMMGTMEKPQWMVDIEEGDDYGWFPSTNLCLVTKDKKFSDLANKISFLLNSVSADGGRNG